MRGLLRATAVPGLVLTLAAGATAYVARVDPTEPGHYPTCPFLFLTGYYCPGCGSLRAVHALAHGDLAGAFGFNPLTVAAVPVLAWLWARWAARSVRGGVRSRPAPTVVTWAFLAVVLAFWLVRNLPCVRFLAP